MLATLILQLYSRTVQNQQRGHLSGFLSDATWVTAARGNRSGGVGSCQRQGESIGPELLSWVQTSYLSMQFYKLWPELLWEQKKAAFQCVPALKCWLSFRNMNVLYFLLFQCLLGFRDSVLQSGLELCYNLIWNGWKRTGQPQNRLRKWKRCALIFFSF